jgi:hypothetical protein
MNEMNKSNLITMQSQFKNTVIWNKWAAFTDRQAENRTRWFLVSFVFQAVFCLPVPAALIYYYNAPVLCLAVTVLLFFGNLVAGMCGSGVRTVISLTVISLAANLVMVAYYAL